MEIEALEYDNDDFANDPTFTITSILDDKELADDELNDIFANADADGDDDGEDDSDSESDVNDSQNSSRKRRRKVQVPDNKKYKWVATLNPNAADSHIYFLCSSFFQLRIVQCRIWGQACVRWAYAWNPSKIPQSICVHEMSKAFPIIDQTAAPRNRSFARRTEIGASVPVLR